MNDDYDILIVGGGMVGASMAVALADQPLRIGMVEAIPFRSAQQPSYDERSIALAYGTRRIFEGLGLWQTLDQGVTAIETIHVSQQGRFGATRLRAREEGVEALGYVVENRVLGAALLERLANQENLTLHCPARLQSLNLDPTGALAVLETDDGPRELTARLVIAADGGKSMVRRHLDIGASEWQYGQTAVISTVTPSQPHGNVAYERFTEHGPLALLPMSDNRCSLVLTVADKDARYTTQLDDDAFLALLQQRFGNRLGRFQRVAPRRAYPLSMVRAREPVRPRLALIGNAAHTLHPIAGQGFNLGIRDVAAMAQVLADAVAAGRDIASAKVLEGYAQWRRKDQWRVIAFTDGLARLFTNPLPPVALARDAGLVALDLLPGAKHTLARYTMGLAGRLPRLGQGLPL